MNQEQNNLQQNSDEQKVLDIPVSKNMIMVSVVSVIVVVLSLMYVWGSDVEKRPSNIVPSNEPALPADDPQVEAFKQVNMSDELDAIEQDIQATNLENIDADFAQMETELAE